MDEDVLDKDQILLQKEAEVRTHMHQHLGKQSIFFLKALMLKTCYLNTCDSVFLFCNLQFWKIEGKFVFLFAVINELIIQSLLIICILSISN